MLHDDSGREVPVAPEGSRLAVLQTATRLRWELPPDFVDIMTEHAFQAAQEMASRAQKHGLARAGFNFDRKLDQLLTSRVFGFPLMLLILSIVFWLTIEGANVPSSILAMVLIDTAHPWLKGVSSSLGLAWWLDGFLLDGVYLSTAWVVSVMLPPMAIFFPLFTMLEDFGYLPTVAFNLDALFKRAGTHGMQALTCLLYTSDAPDE